MLPPAKPTSDGKDIAPVGESENQDGNKVGARRSAKRSGAAGESVSDKEGGKKQHGSPDLYLKSMTVCTDSDKVTKSCSFMHLMTRMETYAVC